jgi:dihydrofolate reductase
MTRTRIHNLSISLDGFATGEGQSADAPFGHAGKRLHEWMFATRFGAPIIGGAGGSAGTDDAFAQQHEPGIGAEIMGAGKFGPPGWQDDADWRGWWGPNPPFHTPTFVLTHRPGPPIEMEGGTTFHFLDSSPAEALEVAREAAGGRDLRIGGGPTIARDFIRRASSTTSTWSRCRSCSAAGCACGTASKRSRRTTPSRRSRRPAASRTSRLHDEPRPRSDRRAGAPVVASYTAAACRHRGRTARR